MSKERINIRLNYEGETVYLSANNDQIKLLEYLVNELQATLFWESIEKIDFKIL